MTYDAKYMPTTAEADAGLVYIATWDDAEGDGEFGTYDEADYDSYERSVLAALDGEWETVTDEMGVYLRRVK